MKSIRFKDSLSFSPHLSLSLSLTLVHTHTISVSVSYEPMFLTFICAGDANPCNGYLCNFGATCKVRDGKAACECPLCSEHHEPVCGTDGNTYSNECKLKYHSCQQKQIIGVSHSGTCSKMILLLNQYTCHIDAH